MANHPDKVIERAEFIHAESRLLFALARWWCNDLRRVRADYLRAGELLCLVHSLEAGLKAFALLDAGKAPRGHELHELLRALSPDLQSRIIADTAGSADRFEARLDSLRVALGERRNVHDHDAGVLDADLAFLRRFARAVQKGLHRHASAAGKAAPEPTQEPRGDDGTSRKHEGTLSCSFCAKKQHEVRKLIAGPTVTICDECIRLCNEIIGEELALESPSLGVLGEQAGALVTIARSFADACDKAVDLPRPIADRARALADEIEVVLAESAKGVAVAARRLAEACEVVELPTSVAERARRLVEEIEALGGPQHPG